MSLTFAVGAAGIEPVRPILAVLLFSLFYVRRSINRSFLRLTEDQSNKLSNLEQQIEYPKATN